MLKFLLLKMKMNEIEMAQKKMEPFSVGVNAELNL
jgi:hypothetical protein